MLRVRWPLVQATVAAALSWKIAQTIGTHPDPFFAPVATVVALNAPGGERGRQAIRLIMGVVLGIAVAELTIFLLPAGLGTLALATFVALAIATALGGARTVIVQAGVSAILTVAVANGEAGFDRLFDAAIGVSVALLFSQVLFSPEPVALLRRAESDALRRLARGMESTARALEAGDADLAAKALNELRALRDKLAELARLRIASPRVARHSVIWQSQHKPAVRESEHAADLDLLCGSCAVLARTAAGTSVEAQRWFAPHIATFAAAMADMAQDVGDRKTRQRAADSALGVARHVSSADSPDDPRIPGPRFILKLVAHDIMVFAGTSPEDAEAAIAATEEIAEVTAPPRAPNLPFGIDRRRRERRGSASKLVDGDPANADVGAKE